MGVNPRTAWFICLAILAIVLSTLGTRSASWAAPKPTPTPMMGMGHSGKPNMSMPTKQVAPAVTAMLMPAGTACGHKVTGSGSVKMIPVHVGHTSGPHVNLVVNLHGARPMHEYAISGLFTGKPPIKWQGTAETDATKMNGSLHVMTRLMPMMRAGRYTAQIMLKDMACMMHPVAYETLPTKITLR